MNELLHSPLTLVVATLLAYRAGLAVKERTDGHALAQPVLVAVALLAVLLAVTPVDYAEYADRTTLVSFWLGPATVALAVPLHRQLARLRGMRTAILVAVPLGAVVSIVSAMLLVRLADGDELLALSMAPKAATTPVSIALADAVGGAASLTAVLTILTGIAGAVAAPAVMTLFRVHDPRVRGVAMGATAHGIGTSRSLHDDETEGAFSGLSMGLTALATSLLLPVVLLVL